MKNFLKFIAFLVSFFGTIGGAVYVYAFSPYFTISPQVENDSQEFSPAQSFVINFTRPIDASYYRDKIKITPETPMKAVVNDTLNQIKIIPKNDWKVDTKYQIELPVGRTRDFMQIEAADFSFKVEGYPQIAEVTPVDGATEVRLDIEEPITVKFDKSTEDFFVDFRLSPEAEVEYQNNDDKTQFSILPKETLQEGTQYDLQIFIKSKNAPDNNYEDISKTSFTTILPKPKTWSENLAERVEQAKKYTTARIKEGKYIDVNLATQIMTIFEDGKLIDSYLISSGKPGMDTPKGEHQIYNKYPRPWSSKYGLYMPYWMAITSDGKFGIHELPEWPGGYKEGQNHLGIPVSHGCMRLGVGPAEYVYNWAEIGTKVIVY